MRPSFLAPPFPTSTHRSTPTGCRCQASRVPPRPVMLPLPPPKTQATDTGWGHLRGSTPATPRQPRRSWSARTARTSGTSRCSTPSIRSIRLLQEERNRSRTFRRRRRPFRRHPYPQPRRRQQVDPIAICFRHLRRRHPRNRRSGPAIHRTPTTRSPPFPLRPPQRFPLRPWLRRPRSRTFAR